MGQEARKATSMIKEYRLTIEIDEDAFTDIDIPYYSGPYSTWLRSKIVLALQGVHGAPDHIRITALEKHELAALDFANSLKETT